MDNCTPTPRDSGKSEVATLSATVLGLLSTDLRSELEATLEDARSMAPEIGRLANRVARVQGAFEREVNAIQVGAGVTDGDAADATDSLWTIATKITAFEELIDLAHFLGDVLTRGAESTGELNGLGGPTSDIVQEHRSTMWNRFAPLAGLVGGEAEVEAPGPAPGSSLDGLIAEAQAAWRRALPLVAEAERRSRIAALLYDEAIKGLGDDEMNRLYNSSGWGRLCELQFLAEDLAAVEDCTVTPEYGQKLRERYADLLKPERPGARRLDSEEVSAGNGHVPDPLVGEMIGLAREAGETMSVIQTGLRTLEDMSRLAEEVSETLDVIQAGLRTLDRCADITPRPVAPVRHTTPEPVPEVVRAQRLEIIDRKGRVRATIDGDPDGYGPAIMLYDGAGHEALWLVTNDRGASTIGFVGGGNTRMDLAAGDDFGPRISFYTPSGGTGTTIQADDSGEVWVEPTGDEGWAFRMRDLAMKLNE